MDGFLVLAEDLYAAKAWQHLLRPPTVWMLPWSLDLWATLRLRTIMSWRPCYLKDSYFQGWVSRKSHKIPLCSRHQGHKWMVFIESKDPRGTHVTRARKH